MLYDGYQVATDILNSPMSVLDIPMSVLDIPMSVLDILNVLEADQPPIRRRGKEMKVVNSLLSQIRARLDVEDNQNPAVFASQMSPKRGIVVLQAPDRLEDEADRPEDEADLPEDAHNEAVEFRKRRNDV